MTNGSDGNISRDPPAHQGPAVYMLSERQLPSPFVDTLAKPGSKSGSLCLPTMEGCGVPEGDLCLLIAG